MSSTDTDTLKKDIEQLKNDMASLVDNYRRSSEKQAQAGLDSARDKYDDIKREASRRSKDVGSEIEARPFTTVLAAFGVGLLIGKIIGR